MGRRVSPRVMSRYAWRRSVGFSGLGPAWADRMRAATEAHDHQYVRDERPGVVCRLCGFRVPEALVHIDAVQRRIVREETK